MCGAVVSLACSPKVPGLVFLSESSSTRNWQLSAGWPRSGAVHGQLAATRCRCQCRPHGADWQLSGRRETALALLRGVFNAVHVSIPLPGGLACASVTADERVPPAVFSFEHSSSDRKAFACCRSPACVLSLPGTFRGHRQCEAWQLREVPNPSSRQQRRRHAWGGTWIFDDAITLSDCGSRVQPRRAAVEALGDGRAPEVGPVDSS